MSFSKKIFISLFILASFGLCAQKKLLDSLKMAYTFERSDAKKASILTEICYNYFDGGVFSNCDSLEKYFDFLSIRFKDYLNQGDSVLLYGKLSIWKTRDSVLPKNRIDIAIKYFYRSISYHKKTANYSKIGESYRLIGDCILARDGGDSKTSKEMVPIYNMAQLAYEKANDQTGCLMIYLMLIDIYQNVYHDPYFSDIYLEKAYKIHKLVKNDFLKAKTLTFYGINVAQKAIDSKYSSIISIESELSVEKKKQLIYATEKLKEALSYWVNLNNSWGYNYAMNEICYKYVYLGEKDSALHYGFTLLKYNKKGNEVEGLASTYGTCGDVYHAFKDYDNALKYMDSCYILSKQLNEVWYIMQLAANYSKIYAIKKNYEKAFEWQKVYIQLNDSLSSAEMKNSTAELQTKYETEKKEGQITSLNQENKIKEAENKRQKLFTIGSIAVGIIILFFTVFIFRSLQANKKKSKIIAQQKLIVEEQKHLVEEKHKEITDSINYAERIQRSFLATKESLDENLKEYFVLFKPKDVVSGDFYWSSTLINGNFVLATADSTGHGVPGAIMSLLNITSLEKAVEQQTGPAEILKSTRKTIIDRLKKDGSAEGGKDGMDCSLMAFDFKNNRVQIAAANNPVWIVRNKEAIEIKPDKMPVGKHDKDQLPFTLHTIDLQQGDLIYTLTDGFPDQFGGEKGKKFMNKNLRELIIKNSHLPLNQQKEHLDIAFINWVGDLEQIDDVTILGIRIS